MHVPSALREAPPGPPPAPLADAAQVAAASVARGERRLPERGLARGRLSARRSARLLRAPGQSERSSASVLLARACPATGGAVRSRALGWAGLSFRFPMLSVSV